MGNTPSQDSEESEAMKLGYVLLKSETGEIRITQGFAKQLEEQVSCEDSLDLREFFKAKEAAKEAGREEMRLELEKEIFVLSEQLEEEKKANSDLKDTTLPILNKAAESVSAKLTPRMALNQMVCTTAYNRIIKCYRENPNKTLYCADELRSFANCVKLDRDNLTYKHQLY